MGGRQGNKVLLFLPNFESGGAERFVVNVCEGVDGSLFTPVIVSICAQPSIYESELDKLGVSRVSLVESDAGFVSRYLLGYRAFARYLKQHHGQFCAAHFNVAHGADLPFVWLSERSGIPVRVVHSHNSSVNNSLKRLGHVLGKRLFSESATARCACSGTAAAWLFSKEVVSSGKYQTIRNGVDTAAFRFSDEARGCIRGELGLGRGAFILNVGRLNHQKNQSFLLEAFEALSRKVDDVTLGIVGTGELEQDLRSRASTLGLEEKILWLGARNDVAQLMSAADLFVLSSAYEGLPFTLIEAQASGLPCVVSDCVSAECELTDLVTRVPLEIDLFSDAMESALSHGVKKREMYARRVEDCGYGLKQTLVCLEEIYREGLR